MILRLLHTSKEGLQAQGVELPDVAVVVEIKSYYHPQDREEVVDIFYLEPSEGKKRK